MRQFVIGTLNNYFFFLLPGGPGMKGLRSAPAPTSGMLAALAKSTATSSPRSSLGYFGHAVVAGSDRNLPRAQGISLAGPNQAFFRVVPPHSDPSRSYPTIP